MSFSLADRNIIITGGLGLLGLEFTKAIIKADGTPIIFDVRDETFAKVILSERGLERSRYFRVDIADEKQIEDFRDSAVKENLNVHGIVNNAAFNPKVEEAFQEKGFESFCVKKWHQEVNIGLTGAILITKIITPIAMDKGYIPSIVNISSDLGIIAPDHRLYNDTDEITIKKPVSYSVIKHGIIGLTKYTATHYGSDVRCNSLVPGGVFNGQHSSFLEKIKTRIPLKRMAQKNEYNEALIFLLSDASKYMTGQNLIIDGGRSIW